MEAGVPLTTTGPLRTFYETYCSSSRPVPHPDDGGGDGVRGGGCGAVATWRRRRWRRAPVRTVLSPGSLVSSGAVVSSGRAVVSPGSVVSPGTVVSPGALV